MGPRSKIKKTRKSIMKSTKGEGRYYTFVAVLGICIACLPLFVIASQLDEHHVGASEASIDSDGDLEAAESQNVGVAQRQRAPGQAVPVAVPTVPIPSVVAPPRLSQQSSQALPSVAAPPAGFVIPKTDLAGAPSYAPRYVVPPVNPWKESFPFEVQQFRRRATDDDGPPAEGDDDYQPQESKGKKHSPGVFKRVRNSIRNTGKAIVGAPSYIFKRYRGTWKKYFGGGGGKKKKGGWKAWSPSSSDKNDGWGGWEEAEPAGGYYDEPSNYPSDKGWKSGGKGWKGYDSNERRSDRGRDRDREYTSYRDYRDRDNNRDYDNPPPSNRSRPRGGGGSGGGERPKYASNYREETHYDDYDGRRTTAYYGGGSTSRKSPKRPSGGNGSSSNYKYDDEY